MECPKKDLATILYYFSLPGFYFPEEPDFRMATMVSKAMGGSPEEIFADQFKEYAQNQKIPGMIERYLGKENQKESLRGHVVTCAEYCLPEYVHFVKDLAKIPTSANSLRRKWGYKEIPTLSFEEEAKKVNKELLNIPLELIV